jgi:hypothetical protein
MPRVLRLLPILGLLAVLLCAVPADATWAQLQHTCNTTCPSGTACNITVTSTGSSHLGVVDIINDLGLADTQITSVSGGGTYTHCTTCHATTGNNSTDTSYTTATTSGTTTITVNLTVSLANPNWTACYHELSSTLGTIALNSGGTPACAATQAAAPPTGCALTLSANNSVIITAFVSSTTTITGVSAPFGNSLQPNNNGSADNENTTSGTAAAWTPTTNDTGVKMAIAFQETSAGGSGGAGIGGKSGIGGKAGVGF